MSSHSDTTFLINRPKTSGLFDEEWYLNTHPDVVYSGLSAIEHYLRIGAWLGREPSPDFDTGLYLSQNPEIECQGHSSFCSFNRQGRPPGRGSDK